MPFRPVAGLLHFLIKPFHILQFVKVVACPPFYFLWLPQKAPGLTPPFKPAYCITDRLHKVLCNIVHHMFYILKFFRLIGDVDEFPHAILNPFLLYPIKRYKFFSPQQDMKMGIPVFMGLYYLKTAILPNFLFMAVRSLFHPSDITL